MTSSRGCIAALVSATLFLFLASAGASPLPFRQPVAGDWNLNHEGDEPGYFHTEASVFYLCTSREAPGNLICPAFPVPTVSPNRQALIGKWTAGEAYDRPALYDPQSGWLDIYDFVDCLPTGDCSGDLGLKLERSLFFGLADATATSGDWFGTQVDSVALITSAAYGAAPAGLVRLYDPGETSPKTLIELSFDPTEYHPVAGRWVSVAADSLGFFDPELGELLLFDGIDLSQIVALAGPTAGLLPIAGQWPPTQPTDSIALYHPQGPSCAAGSGCHRVNFYWQEDTDRLAIDEEIKPQLDSDFPDDPPDP
ncbi:MAG: hypothetical protein AAF657_22280 [Acidobacteriota bacterium]